MAEYQICPECSASLTVDIPVEHNGVLADPACYSATVDGIRVRLTASEFKLLYVLLKASPRPLGRDSLFYRVVPNEDTESNVIEVYLCRLRRKLSLMGVDRIRTIKGVGWWWDSSTEPSFDVYRHVPTTRPRAYPVLIRKPAPDERAWLEERGLL
jgi:DNA-binding winged helix-turn-helix (wHTH) protein